MVLNFLLIYPTRELTVLGYTFTMYGGTIIGNTAEAYVAEKTITEGEGVNP